MSVSPIISIIIPVYNLEKLVSDCILSCINQTFSDFEIIIVNDGSQDGSTAIIDEYVKKDSRIRHIKKENGGLSKARKTGIEQAIGEFVFHLDGDDIIPDTTLENLYNAAKISDSDIVAGDINVVKSKSNQYEHYSSFGSGNGAAFLEFILIHKLHYLWGKLIRRSLYNNQDFEIVTEIKTVPPEDQIHLLQLCVLAKNVTTIKDIVYLYKINENSITQRQINTRDYIIQNEYFAFMLNKLQQKLDFTLIVNEQINIRILQALYLGLRKHGSYVVDKKKSTSLMKQTIIKSVFSKKTMFFDHFSLLLRCTVSLLFPRLPFLITKLSTR